MPSRRATQTAAIRFDIVDAPDAIGAIVAGVTALGGRVRTLATVRQIDGDPALVEIELEVGLIGGRLPHGMRVFYRAESDEGIESGPAPEVVSTASDG